MKNFVAILNVIDNINQWAGKIVSWVILAIMLSIVYDVFMRYFIRKPTIWADELCEIMLLCIVCIGAGTGLLHNSHVKVGILYDKWSPKVRALVDLVTYPIILLICVILVTDGSRIAWDSYLHSSRTETVFRPLLWPIQSLIPIAGVLLGMQVLAKWLRDFIFFVKGINLQSKWISKKT
jgi:TRAP-type mannitol/chloroaromatic compound transport system permease small subunit